MFATIESLEARQFMSAAPAPVHIVPVVTVPHVSASLATFPSCTGNWSGAASVTGSKSALHFSANFTRQKGVSLTGTFNFSLVGGPVLTTASVGLSPTFLVQVNGSAGSASFVGFVMGNGTYITGRWSFVSKKGAWTTGTFVMTKN